MARYFKINKTSSNNFKTQISKFKTINTIASKSRLKSRKDII